jgi:excisionase family DNA binding protein
MKPATTITSNGVSATTDYDEWLTPAEIAKEMKLSVEWVYAKLASGKLESHRFGKYLRVTRAALRAYQAAHRQEAK